MSSHHLDRRALLLAGAGIATTAPLLSFEPAAAGRSRTKVMKGHFDVGVKDWVYRPFMVPAGVREIEVEYSYRPTNVGPTTINVVDIGIFGPAGNEVGNVDGFRGWSGGSRRSFRLSRTSATPGYLPGRITPGRWLIALGPYQITTPGTPYKVTVTLHFGKKGPAFAPTPAPTVANPPELKSWWRGDLHVHTVHSDGSQRQADVIGFAKAADLDFIGTSEHNTSSAMGTWGKYVPDDFLVIPGEEVTTRYGHWLAAGLPSGTWIDWRYGPADGKLAGFTEQVRELGGLSIACHPYQGGTGIGWRFGTSFTEMDAIEVWNGPWGSDDQMTLNRWHQLLTSGVFKPAVGNSDTHKQSQTIGLPQTVVRADGLSVESVIGGYRRGNSWLAESAAVDLVFTATLDDLAGECGDRVPSEKGQQVDVHLEVTGVEGCTATLYGPGTANVLGTATAVDGTIALDTTVPGGTAFVRAEVRRGTLPTDPMVALTNPIFLTAAG